MVINLDSSFRVIEGKEIAFDSFVFAGGEPHIRIKDKISTDEVIVTQRLNSFNDVGMLLVAVDALRRMGIRHIELFIPYFPAARQDRLMVSGESLTVKVYTDLINSLKLQKVTIFDPHSEVAPALLNNCVVINNHAFIKQVTSQLPKELLLISPDGGALKKIHKLAAQLKRFEVLACGKTRNVESGQLSGFTVPVNNLEGRPCLIVDDICDGGGTFLGLAKELEKCNAGDLYLAVSHGIFSKGIDVFDEYFKRVYTTDSFKNVTGDSITCLQLRDVLR